MVVVEVTDKHVREMGERPMIFFERMSLLDRALGGVDIDLREDPDEGRGLVEG